jgi:hypothetical protein
VPIARSLPFLAVSFTTSTTYSPTFYPVSFKLLTITSPSFYILSNAFSPIFNNYDSGILVNYVI